MLRHLWLCLMLLALTWPGISRAQETVEEAAVEDEAAADDVVLLAPEELEALVAPIAFYPDEVLAVTLPAATYPLDIVQAARFLEQQKAKPDAAPSENWDPSILSLLNYPVVLNMMNEDLDWTTALGEAVLNQQGDVIDAIQQVRRTAYTGGQLQTNEQTTIIYENDTIEIESSDPDVVYIPIYEPAPAPPTAEQLPVEGTTDGTTIENTTVNNYYPSGGVTYSEPYTPYYDQSAAFWTGALVGGVTMGFLMDWDDDDIDIDFDDGDFDDWSPGRGDVNIDGDVNIGNDINVGKGDSWRDLRAQRGDKAQQLPSAKRKGAQPAASNQARKGQANTRAKNKQPGAANTVKKKPAQAKTADKKAKKNVTKQQPNKKPSTLGNVERGQNTNKAAKRGAGSQQKVQQAPKRQQQAAPTNKPRQQNTAKPQQRKQNNSAFGSHGSGKQTKKSSNRGGGSSKKLKKR